MAPQATSREVDFFVTLLLPVRAHNLLTDSKLMKLDDFFLGGKAILFVYLTAGDLFEMVKVTCPVLKDQ